MKYIDAVIPFIELPDITYAKEVKINGPALAAVNVGARFGVMGSLTPMKASKGWMERLSCKRALWRN